MVLSIYTFSKFTDNPCSDLECDHMCVNTKPEPKCMCADGFTLDYDDETCTGNFFLLFLEVDTCVIVRCPICANV